MDVNNDAISVHQWNNCLVGNSFECFNNDGASDDKAAKCCISNYYPHNGRRRLLVVKATASNNKCMYLANNYIRMYTCTYIN